MPSPSQKWSLHGPFRTGWYLSGIVVQNTASAHSLQWQKQLPTIFIMLRAAIRNVWASVYKGVIISGNYYPCFFKSVCNLRTWSCSSLSSLGILKMRDHLAVLWLLREKTPSFREIASVVQKKGPSHKWAETRERLTTKAYHRYVNREWTITFLSACMCLLTF